MKCRVLVVEDDDFQRESLVEILKSFGFEVEGVDCAESARSIIDDFDVFVCDVRLSGIDGITLLKEIKKRKAEAEVVIITAFSNVEDAVEAIKLGAFHYITKPYDVEVLVNLLKKACELVSLRKGEQIVYASRKMAELLKQATLFAKSDAPVLITGESGSGKELLAKFIHSTSDRKGEFVAVNCTAIPEGLFESELFGHEKGAFSGASSSKLGLIEIANGGTLFLDEIGDMPLPLQAKLLRFLQEGTFRKVGATKEKKVDVKIVAATNRELEKLVKEGKFRQDLYFRLNVLSLKIPPLRERPEDILVLAEHFLKKYSSKYAKKTTLSTSSIKALTSYDFPGNVRELENMIHRAVLISADKIEPEHLFPEEGGTNAKKSLPQAVEELEKRMIREALAATGGVQTRAAKLLGIDEKTLRYKRKKYRI